MSEDLIDLQMEFPAFRIWREEMPGRVRYIARSRYWRLNPHTVVTADPRELRAALQPVPVTASDTSRAFSAAEPNIARMYAYWLDGKDHYATDREAADRVLARFPEIGEIARVNRAFLRRAVRYLANQGITQFLDIGSGLPASPNIHETARTVAPTARVAYVDHDPVVLAHARALLAVDNRVGVISGDLRDPSGFLTDPEFTALIDRAKPTGVLVTSVLHFLNPAEADATVAALREWMAMGSYLVISAGTSTGTDPELIRLLQEVYGGTAPVTGRSTAEIEAWFEGLTLVPPGLVDVWAWRPEIRHRPATSRARFLAGVGHKVPGGLAWSV